MAESSPSNTFELFAPSTITIGVIGTRDSMTATVQFSPDGGTTWATFASGGSNVTLTSTDNLKNLQVGGGLLFRIATGADGSNAGDIDLYVEGNHLDVTEV